MISWILFALLSLYQTNAQLYKLQTAPQEHQQHPLTHNIPSPLMDLVPNSKEIARQELVYLFMSPPTNEIAYVSMSALQLLCWLRMAKVPFYALSNHFLLASPMGKVQFAQINGQIYNDPNEAIEQIEKMETEKNSKKPYKKMEKSEKELKTDEALDTLQNIILADSLASSIKYKYDGIFDADGTSRLELWLKDEGLKEQMFMTLTKMDAMSRDEELHENGHFTADGVSNLTNELKFMEAYFNIKNSGSETEKDEFLISHGISFMELNHLKFAKDEEIKWHREMKQNQQKADNENLEWVEVDGSDEEVEVPSELNSEITEIITIKQKKWVQRPKQTAMDSPLSDLRLATADKLKPHRPRTDWERFEWIMSQRVNERVEGELTKLRSSLYGLAQTLATKRIKIPQQPKTEDGQKKQEKIAQEQKKENGERQNEEVLDNLAAAFSSNASIQRATAAKKAMGKWANLAKNMPKMLADSLAGGPKQIWDFKQETLGNCSDQELLAAFKHAIDELAQIATRFEGFLFHNKATATEARLLATLGHLFASPRIIPKLQHFMEIQYSRVPLYDETVSLGQVMVGRPAIPVEYVIKKSYRERNVKILSEYFEMRREQLGLDLPTLDVLRKWPWNLGRMAGNEKKYMGPYPFKTDNMQWLPEWAEKHWQNPFAIVAIPLQSEMAGKDHIILTSILNNLAFYFWDNLKGKDKFGQNTIFFECWKGLMHFVAAYLCGLDYTGDVVPPTNFMSKFKEPESSKCAKMHLKVTEQLDARRKQLLRPMIAQMRRLIAESVEKFTGIESNIFGAIQQAMKKEEEKQGGKSRKGKTKIGEPNVEEEGGQFVLDLF